jgi:integrase
MPRPRKGARLYLRERDGREGTWVIRDGAKETGTGCGERDLRGAEEALAAYIGKRYKPDFSDHTPASVLVADVIGLYAKDKASDGPTRITAGYHFANLLQFWGDKTCADVSGANCRNYVAWRVAGGTGRVVGESTARRELQTFSAALGYAYRERKVDRPIPVTFPEQAPPRDRWLTRTEAARLLAGALGWRAVAFDRFTQQPTIFRRLHPPQYHVARFILIGLGTGTRHDAILRLRWHANTAGGWIDLEKGMVYRRGEGQVETRKRRTPVPMSRQLTAHARRWRKLTVIGPVEYAGRLIKKERRGFDRAKECAGLGDDVVPHVLRHTYATWAVLAGVPLSRIARALGASEKMVEQVYGHHEPEYLRDVAEAGSAHRRVPRRP